jgi:hypothetical protein
MSILEDKIQKALNTILEADTPWENREPWNLSNGQWKDPSNPNYIRAYAEDCLHKTYGPLRKDSTWSTDKWDPRASRYLLGFEPPPPRDYEPGGRAPVWTEGEVTVAYAGDMGKAGDKNYKMILGPANSPLLNLAKKLARAYKIDNPEAIQELYTNGLLRLSQLMKPGVDAGAHGPMRKDGTRGEPTGFISWIKNDLEKSLISGFGTTKAEKRAKTAVTTLSKAKNAAEIDSVLAPTFEGTRYQISPEYQEEGPNKYDKDPGNPYGKYTWYIYQIGNDLKQALQLKDAEYIDSLRKELLQKINEIAEGSELTLGLSTGSMQAISTPRGTKNVPLTSIDKPIGDEGFSAAETLVARADQNAEPTPTEAAFYTVLEICLNLDNASAKFLPTDPVEWQNKIVVPANQVHQALKLTKEGSLPKELHIERNQLLKGFDSMEFRCVLRLLGGLCANYPGKGKMRSALEIPRHAAGWWKPYEDPEIEAIPEFEDDSNEGEEQDSGQAPKGEWVSAWRLKGYPLMGNKDIAEEFRDEAQKMLEFGIPSAWADMVEAGNSKIMSDQTVNKYGLRAYTKLIVVATMYKNRSFSESVDDIDRMLISETALTMARVLSKSFESTVFVPQDDLGHLYRAHKMKKIRA